MFDLFKLTVFACSISFDIHLIIPVKLVGEDLPFQTPFVRDNVHNDVGLLLPREREGFTKAACYKKHHNLAP